MKCHRCGYDNAEIMSASMKVERKQKELEREVAETHELLRDQCNAVADLLGQNIDLRAELDAAKERVKVLRGAVEKALALIVRGGVHDALAQALAATEVLK